MLNFVTQKRILDVNGEKKVKYNAKLVYRGTLTMKDVSNRLINMSTLHPAEAYLAVELVADVLVRALSEGFIVDMGRLGRFKTSIKAKAQDNPEDVDADTITDVTCIFKPNVEIKRQLQNTPLHRERELSEQTQKQSFTIGFYGKKRRLQNKLERYEQLEREYKQQGWLIDDSQSQD